MTSFKEFYSEWLIAADLKGQPRQVTIESWKVGSVKDSRTGEDKKQVVIKFVNVKKPFGCNITNCRTIAAIIGTDQMEHWVGRKIVLFPTTVMVGPDEKDAIRVRAVEAQQIMQNRPAPVPQQPQYVAPPVPAMRATEVTDPNFVQTSVNQMVRDFAPPDVAIQSSPEADWGNDDENDDIPF